ncbi:MAG: glycosyltransferase family 4 protein [Formivibrio sp.]|nr:glycosyltransferase family 4 protein [Formivibrio sp.]
MKLKVAHVVRQYYPSVGGMEDVVRNIADYQLHHTGHQPHIFTLNRVFRSPNEILPAQDVFEGVPVTRLPFTGSERYPFCPQILKAVSDADVIHVHGVDFFYDYLAITHPLHHKPLIASTHGGFFHTQFAPTLKQIFFNTVTRTSSCMYEKVIATSENDGALFGKIMGSDKLVVIENGVNVEKFADLSAKTSVPTLIYFGRWSSNKALSETLQLFAKLYALDPEWRLIIAGREYDETEQSLREVVERLSLSAVVEVVPNPSDAELAALIGRSSYFVCLSRHEGFGIAPIEAMSAGLYPILNRIPPFEKLVAHTGLGYLVSNDDERDARAILDLHHAEAFSQQRRDLQESVASYTWKSVAAQYVKCYEDIYQRGQQK